MGAWVVTRCTKKKKCTQLTPKQKSVKELFRTSHLNILVPFSRGVLNRTYVKKYVESKHNSYSSRDGVLFKKY